MELREDALGSWVEVLTLSLVMMFSFGANLHLSYSYVKITGLQKV